jgi:hypothetical protein
MALSFPSNPTIGQTYGPASNPNMWTWDGQKWVCTGSGGGGGSGEEIGQGVIGMPSNSFLFTASGTYTPSAGITSIMVELRGGGGMGGNANNAGAYVIGGGGGGSGAYSRAIFLPPAIGASQPVTIGAGDTTGSGGGTTSFGSLLTAPGGFAGYNNDATTSFGAGGGGGVPGTGPSGALLLPGIAGLPGSNNPVMTAVSGVYTVVRPIAVGGEGGLNQQSPVATSPVAIAEGAAGTMGAGGNGSATAGENVPGAVVAGGNGGSGWCLITEFMPATA